MTPRVLLLVPALCIVPLAASAASAEVSSPATAPAEAASPATVPAEAASPATAPAEAASPATAVAASPTPAPAPPAPAPPVPAPVPAPAGLPLGEHLALELGLQVRPRLVLHSGLDFVDGGGLAVVSQRSRLAARLSHRSGVAAVVRLQDVRLWGEEPDTLNSFDAAGFDVQEAYGELPIAGDHRLRLGRQEIIWDASRIVGNVGWTQRARSFDAARFQGAFGAVALDAFYAKVNTLYDYPDGTRRPADTVLNTDVGGVHLGLTPAEGHDLAVLWLVDALWHADSVRHTAGLFAQGGVGPYRYQAEGYYQAGEIAGDTVSAFLAAGRAGWTAPLPAEPGVTVWGEWLSGDGTPAGTFHTPYPTNHKFYGEMDIFLAIPAHTGNLGLVDLGGRLGAKPGRGLEVHLDWHHFLSDEPDAQGDRTFGDELDLSVSGKPVSGVALTAVYALFLPGEALRTVRGIAEGAQLVPEHFFYLTVDFAL